MSYNSIICLHHHNSITCQECGVTVGYNSSHVTVLSECEGEGQLHSFTADQLSQLSSSHTLRWVASQLGLVPHKWVRYSYGAFVSHYSIFQVTHLVVYKEALKGLEEHVTRYNLRNFHSTYQYGLRDTSF